MTFGRSPSGRAAAADAVEPVPVSSIASIPNAVRKTFRAYATAPRDGTPFVVGSVARHHPETGDLQLQFWNRERGQREWITVINQEPRYWTTPLPGCPEFATVSNDEPHKVIARRVKTVSWVVVASAIEAATAGETTQIGSTEGESAVPNGETPK